MSNCTTPNNIKFFAALLCGLFLLASVNSFASSPIYHQLETIDVESGLPQSTVRAITQDQFGFIYFATDEGISQFDGISHKNIQSTAKELQSLFSFSSLCDSENGLWAGSLDGGVLYYSASSRQWKEFLLSDIFGAEAGKQVIGCSKDIDNNIWFITERGLFSLGVDENIELIRKDSFWIEGNNQVNHLMITEENRFYIATEQGLYTLNYGRFTKLASYSQPATRVVQTLLDARGRLWVLNESSVSVYNNNKGEWEIIASSLIGQLNRKVAHERLIDIFQDSAGRTWIGTETQGILIIDENNQSLHHLKKNPSYGNLPDNHITSIYQSRDNVMWLGTWLSGAIKLIPSLQGIDTTRVFSTNNGEIVEPSIRSIYRSETGELWVGTDNAGVLLSDDNGKSYTQYKRVSDASGLAMSAENYYQKQPSFTLPSNTVRNFYQRNNGDFLIGTDRGLLKLTDQGFEYLGQNIEAALSTGDLIRGVLEDSKNTLWVGTYDKGLFWFNDETGQYNRISLSQNSLIDRVAQVHLSMDGMLWVGTDTQGYFIVDPIQKSVVEHIHFNMPNRLRAPGNSIWSFYQPNSQTMWVGSYGQGLGQLNLQSRVFTYFRESDGLPNDVIYSITQDQQGWFWVSTNQGLARFSPGKKKFISLNKVHGLPHSEFNSGAYFKDDSGRLYYGSLKGLVIIDPSKLMPNTGEHQVYLSDLRVNNQSVEQATNHLSMQGDVFSPKQLTFEKDYEQLFFSFAVSDYLAPDKNIFAYRLLGYQDDWVFNEGKVRSASFNSLPAGYYRLEVKAKNSYGVWSDKLLKIDIQLQPPWWLSGWAYFSYLILIMSVIWGSFELWRRYRRQHKLMLERLHYLVEHRTQELKNKNEQLKSLNSELQHANEKLEKVSMTDSLTGLGNRRMMYQYLEKDVGRVNRAYISLETDLLNLPDIQKHDLQFYLVDIDDFKSINDRYGHTVGDKVLIQISQILTAVSREGDYVVRYGGEEFLLVMRDTPRSESALIAERIQQAFHSEEINISADLTIPLRCSIGFAPYPFSSLCPAQLLPEQVIQIADIALYCAKASGKNCWIGLNGHYKKDEVIVSDVLNNTEQLIEQGLVEVITSDNVSKLNWTQGRH